MKIQLKKIVKKNLQSIVFIFSGRPYRFILNLIIVSLAVISCKNTFAPKQLLPIFGEKKLSNTDTIYHTISDFSFTNQFGENVTNKTVKNKIYVADFFFCYLPKYLSADEYKFN